jgi:hypothetical protein
MNSWSPASLQPANVVHRRAGSFVEFCFRMLLMVVALSKTAYMKRIIVPAVVAIFVLLACSKGDTGPAGTTGAAGASGPQGPAGTANVIYSSWFTPSAYIRDTVFSLYHFYHNDSTADITQGVVDSGLVIVYAKLDGYNTSIWPANQVAELPITLTYRLSSNGIDYSDYWSADITAGCLKIDFVDDQNYYSDISTSHQFRYIIIPGGKSTVDAVDPGAGSSSGRQFDASGIQTVIRDHSKMTYAEVCASLGIEKE